MLLSLLNARGLRSLHSGFSGLNMNIDKVVVFVLSLFSHFFTYLQLQLINFPENPAHGAIPTAYQESQGGQATVDLESGKRMENGGYGNAVGTCVLISFM